MPLQSPYAYIVSHDLKEPIASYGPYFEELKRSLKWWHFVESTWIVLRYETQVELANKLRPLIYRNDRLLIQPAKGPSDGWLPQEAWTWLDQIIPKEW